MSTPHDLKSRSEDISLSSKLFGDLDIKTCLTSFVFTVTSNRSFVRQNNLVEEQLFAAAQGLRIQPFNF